MFEQGLEAHFLTFFPCFSLFLVFPVFSVPLWLTHPFSAPRASLIHG